MHISQMKAYAQSKMITAVKFIESGCSPIVIELSYISDRNIERQLLSKGGKTLTCKSIEQAYCICRDAGIHQAELVQTIPHDEACAGPSYQNQPSTISLRF